MPKKASRRKRDGVPGHCSSLAAGRAKAKADSEKTSQDPVSSDSDESLEDELNNLDSPLVSQEGDCGVDEEQPATKAEGSGTKPKRMKKKLKRLKVPCNPLPSDDPCVSALYLRSRLPGVPVLRIVPELPPSDTSPSSRR